MKDLKKRIKVLESQRSPLTVQEFMDPQPTTFQQSPQALFSPPSPGGFSSSGAAVSREEEILPPSPGPVEEKKMNPVLKVALWATGILVTGKMTGVI